MGDGIKGKVKERRDGMKERREGMNGRWDKGKG